MANELTVTVSGSFSKNGVPPVPLPGGTAVGVTVAGNNSVRAQQTTGADTAIPLGPVSGALGWYSFKNLDATNAINIKSAVAGTILLTLNPGDPPATGRFPSGVTAPSSQAAAGSPLLDYFIAEA